MRPLVVYDSDWAGSQSLLPVNACGVLRAKDCIFFFPDDGHFNDLQDSFARTYDPTCRGFNPQQSHWTNHKATWPNALNTSSIIEVANGCDLGPACGSTLNYDFRL